MTMEAFSASPVRPSLRLGEIVLKTAAYETMKGWYRNVLGIGPFLEHVPDAAIASPAPFTRMCFYRLHFDHPWQEMIAIFEVPGTRIEAAGGDPGLHHMQLRSASPADLAARYGDLRDLGVTPHRALDHGPSTSFYYRDPDRNVVELSASNFQSGEEMLACLRSDAYRANPPGRAVDPEEFAARHFTAV